MDPAASPRAVRWKARAISISPMNGNLAGNSRFFRTNGTLTTITCRTRRFHTTISAKRHRPVYLTGQGDRGYFGSARLFFRRAYRATTFRRSSPIRASGLGLQQDLRHRPGQILRHWAASELDFNLTSLSASSASFQAVGPRVLDNAYGLYDICTNYVPGQAVGDLPSARAWRRLHTRDGGKRPGSANSSIRS